ncbi:hypothetical protein My1_059 [Pectobacterium phage My1]|uniref:Uncharacterized protein n=1 Tax=Pectobacterium phage My1 TaxID=1204539 RepID=J9QM65_9CAUD|nr:hypothetical protein My1_059 [Pectobacterium phage My1]AFQ22218.1 hypothetical protein My1_059 [Pectobacterium phage My1]
MKGQSSIPRFFWHYLSEDAIRQGWNMEFDMYDALKPIENEMAFTLKTSGFEIKYKDLIDVAKGNLDNPVFKEFCFLVYHEVDKTSDRSSTILVSMHSGSSDYFTLGMLEDYVNSRNQLS